MLQNEVIPYIEFHNHLFAYQYNQKIICVGRYRFTLLLEQLWNVPLYGCPIFYSTVSPFNGHLGCFPFFSIIYGDAATILVTFFNVQISSSSLRVCFYWWKCWTKCCTHFESFYRWDLCVSWEKLWGASEGPYSGQRMYFLVWNCLFWREANTLLEASL